MKKNICLVFNFASLYRKNIYQRIDAQFDAEWYFCKNNTDIREFDKTILNKVRTFEHKKLIGPAYRMSGASELVAKKGLDTYLVIGDFFCVSIWWMLIKKSLFYRKKRIFLWTHGFYGKESLFRRILKRKFINMADGTFLYGNYAKRLMIENGYDGNKLHVIHNSLDYENQLQIRNSLSSSDIYIRHFGNNWPTIIFIGRLTETKRLDILIEALQILKNRGLNYNLVLVGNGSNEDNLQKLADKLCVSDNIWFYGESYDEQTNAELIYNADVCVSPGNVGLTSIHSLMFGTPVITHNDFSHQMPEFEAISDGINGAFFTRDNSTSLADCIYSWLSSVNDREALRSKCFNEIDNYWNPDYQIQILTSVI